MMKQNYPAIIGSRLYRADDGVVIDSYINMNTEPPSLRITLPNRSYADDFLLNIQE